MEPNVCEANYSLCGTIILKVAAIFFLQYKIKCLIARKMNLQQKRREW